MKSLFTIIINICLAISLVFLLQACAGSGFMSDDAGVQEYSHDFEKMKEVVEQAIRNSNMNINHVNESESEGEMTLTVSRSRYVDNQEVQQEQGEIRIYKLEEGRTRIEIDNPDYHYSVPEHQKEDYQRIIFMRIDNVLERQDS